MNTMDVFHCVDTLRMVVERFGKPEIFNSNQTSAEFVQALRSYCVQIRMNGRGHSLDNAKMERFWWALNYEDIKIKEICQFTAIAVWCSTRCNTKRIHSALQYKTPDEVYFGACKPQSKGYSNSKVFTPIFQ